MLLGETIAAIATPPGRGGVAIVRTSGPDAFALAKALTGREAVPGRIRFARLKASDGTPLDEAVVLAFRAPHSYTGEDVVEYQCHGGLVAPRRVLAACLDAGARLARRGEFTERAFLNGRLSYDQAESVLELIDAKTDRAADRALEGLSGDRRTLCRDLYEKALDTALEVERALDVIEDALPDSFYVRLERNLGELERALGEATRRIRERALLNGGARVVLAGPANAGKSSLLNALLGENRAIVSSTPGTTRDTIEAWLDLEGWPVRLTDTAGLRHGAEVDPLEGEGVRRAEALAGRADVVVLLDDPTAAERAVAPAGIEARRIIRVSSKCDLARGEGLCLSSKTGEGLESLRKAIVATLEALTRDAADDAAPADPDGEAIRTAARLIGEAVGAPPFAAREADLVLLASGLRRATETLGARLGATYAADLLDRLFSRFCVGK